MPSLTGVSQVICTQAGKNLLPYGNADTGSINQVDFSVDGEGRFTVSGTATGGSATFYSTLTNTYTIQDGDYLHLMNSTALANVSVGLIDENNSGIVAPACSPVNRIFSLSSYAGRTVATVTIYVPNGATYEGTITPMIIHGNTATTFEKYTAPTVSAVSLGRTIYGGTVDVVNGTGTEGAQRVKIGDLDWTYQSANTRFFTASLTSTIAKPATNGELAPFLYSDVLSPLSFTAAQNVDKSICVATSGNIFVKDTTYTDKETFLQDYGDTYIIVGKGTPETFTFPPISPTPETPLGASNFWADEGDSEVTYRADINMLISSLSGNRGLMMSRPQLEAITEENKEEESPEVTEK